MAIEDKEKLNIKTLGNRVYLDSGTLTPLLKNSKKVLSHAYVKQMMNATCKFH